MFRPIGFDKGIEALVEASLTDIPMNAVAQGSPIVHRPLELVVFRALDGTVEGDPAHDFREDVMLRLPAPLPDAVVRLTPDLGKMLEHRAAQGPRLLAEIHFRHARLIEGVDQLAIDVELQLRMGGVADPDRL